MSLHTIGKVVFFHHVGQAQELENDDNDASEEVQDLTTPAVPKLISHREATSCLEDVFSFLESKGNSDTADALSRAISNVESDCLQRRTSPLKVNDLFFKIVNIPFLEA